jgi:DnaD/phage-associated family protein
MSVQPFAGFPAGRLAVVAVPDLLVSRLLAEIDALDELKATLVVFWYLQRHKKSGPKLVTWRELAAGAAHLLGPGAAGVATLRSGLDRAVARGTLLRVRAEVRGDEEDLYLVNSAHGRRTLERLRRGELSLDHLVLDVVPAGRPSAERPSVFALYEQNIGLLTPLVAEELAACIRRYPIEWVEDAIREAVAYNRRSWRYVTRILERWEHEGRSNEASRRGAGQRATRGPASPCP